METKFVWEFGLFDPSIGLSVKLTLENDSDALSLMRKAYDFNDKNHWNALVRNPFDVTTPTMPNPRFPDVHGKFNLNYCLLIPKNTVRR